MFRKIRRLLNVDAPAERSGRPEDTVAEVAPSLASGGHRAGDWYFETMAQMQDAISKRDYENAASLARKNLQQIAAWVREMREEWGSFNIGSIPAIEQGGTMLAFVGDDTGLAEMRQLVGSIKDLERWNAEVDQHEQDRLMFGQILEAISSNPNCRQTDVKDLVGARDGRRVSILISYLEKGGKIYRSKEGKAYRLTIAGSKDAPDPPPDIHVGSHRTSRKSPPLREINVSSLSYVPLPRSPLKWEETESGHEREDIPAANDFFEIRDADWQLASIDKIPPDERPDTAFREMRPVDSGMLMIDDLGNAENVGHSKSAALRYNRAGQQIAKAGFPHGIYRLGVHPLGRGLVAMSKECVAHAYDDDLRPLFQTALIDTPEIEALLQRFDIPTDQIKNHIRCVALSRDNARYLFTVVDEIWCITIDGKGLWGAKLPIKDGWTRVATPSDRFGTSDEVERALKLMNLNFPITPDDVKHRYRDLAKKWHPDLNPGNSEAGEKMTAINSAAEILTGVDANTLPQYTGATFIQDTEPVEVVVDGVRIAVDIGYEVGEIFAADWIYAASFAALSDSVYLAGYSGRVVCVDENGKGVRVYDIGSVPRRIVDTGDYLYILTDTRLYVLRDDAMLGLVDTFDGGDLIVAQTGFGLIEKKRFRWFREDGTYLGSVVSKNPIRRVYSTSDGIVVESRQRRAVIRGVPAWWE